MNEQETCEECEGIAFHLDPDGRIICANDDCHAVFGSWISDDQSALIVQFRGFGRRKEAADAIQR